MEPCRDYNKFNMKYITDIRIQAITGILFSIYLILHLLNHAVAIAGPESYNAVQYNLRIFYQHPFIEIPFIIIIPVIHLYIGIKQAWKRKFLFNGPLYTLLFRFSGYIVGMIYFIHVFFTRGQALLHNLSTSYESIAYSLTARPLKYFFLPYYIFFSACGIIHMTFGLIKAIQILSVHSIRSFIREKQSSLFILALLLFSVVFLGLLSMAGYIYELEWTEREFHYKHYRKLLDMLEKVLQISISLD
jgi:succinate dehydrogenase/fumarate reductase cytochrome b subunit